ncbi:mechanosensitive ion channel family protein [Minwuia sp.]|uniref:mechanosensitive ion channel family protein n=1 Tax=Minwuia sp. TaxID=2493630 RepID=UPI003A90E0D7
MTEEETSTTMEIISAYVVEYAFAFVGVIVILVAGFYISRWVARLAGKAMIRTGKIDAMLANFVSNIIRYAIIAFAVIAALDQFGVETTSFVAVIGAAGLAIGLALQGTLSNLAAGVMILIFRPFKQGQFIDASGISGTVDSVSLFVTEMHTADNVQILVPNSKIWNTSIKNFSHHPTRRLDLVLGIGYSDDIGHAIETLREMANADERVHDDPSPMIAVANLGESSVDLTIRLWCNAGDYWGLKFDFLRRMKEKMDEIGVEIPFPQRSVHTVVHEDRKTGKAEAEKAATD